MSIIVIAQVIMRYVFASPFVWAEEAARYLLIWISCLGSAYAVKKNMHISVLFLNKKLVGHIKSLVTIIIQSSVMVFFVLCAIYGFLLAMSEWGQISPGMGIRMTWVLISISVGSGLMALFTIEAFIEDILNMISKKEPLC